MSHYVTKEPLLIIGNDMTTCFEHSPEESEPITIEFDNDHGTQFRCVSIEDAIKIKEWLESVIKIHRP